jgi:tryptophan synthase beta chain
MSARGSYGPFGGQYVAETLMGPLRELESAYTDARKDPEFQRELRHYLTTYAGRPTALTHARRLSEELAGAQIYLKREDLLHGGAHKLNNVLGQGLLARRMGKARLIAETGAGQHGVATAMVGAVLGLPVEVYMGETDAVRQRPNVDRMRLLGARLHLVKEGSRTLKDAVNEALREWTRSAQTTHYCIGSVVGPHPFPQMVADFQSVIGKELRRQCASLGFDPDILVACVGGGSNAAGTFSPFVKQRDVKMVGVEAGGSRGKHAATLSKGKPGILHGALSYVLSTADGQVAETHSVSAGLDYPGVGPAHAAWKESGRVHYTTASDTEAMDAFVKLCRSEGILPALESCHALAYAMKVAPRLPSAKRIVVTLSGRGDKDLETVARWKESAP